ncbi:hypothetical protein KQI42_09675 [Tissierella sp. MSJ-40]|uniref:Phage protein n=1 Tax=Tissierella simiarum TaxID=2841534 RepID=A0ABS6E7S2_9FIRM|nr:hypothetical protein [Tissierella simiarum]MBU5438278.1 hypothetical protein [Tissierella simiarum]
MIVINKNEGTKIPYTIKTSKVTFDDELMLNLEKYERDDPNHIDVCRDKFGNLVCGVIPGVAEVYVAQIDIPAREYDFIADGLDENEQPKEVPFPVPFDIDKCTLTLWTLV